MRVRARRCITANLMGKGSLILQEMYEIKDLAEFIEDP